MFLHHVENSAHQRSATSSSQGSEAWKDHEEGKSSAFLSRFECLCVSLTVPRSLQFIINASQPASDKIFDVSAFEKFLHDKIKVDNRVGNLGDTIAISQQGDGKIEVIAHTQFSGRYLKYL